MYAGLPPSPRFARHFPPSSGEADIKEERNYIFHYLNTLFRLSYAGFFSESHIMFFPLSSFRFCQPLKNDGRGVLFCHNVLMLNEYIKERIQALKLSPLVGESGNRQVDERGKCEQKGKNSFLQNGSKYLPVILERS